MRFRLPPLGRGPRQAPGGETPPDPRPKPSFLGSMPPPLMALFLAALAVALGMVVWTVAFPNRVTPPAPGERRPPPAGSMTHDVGEVVPAPVPSPLPRYEPPCPGFDGVRPEGGPPGVVRLTAALRPLCALAGPGVAPELAEAVRALDGVRIRFADFARTGVESVLDRDARRILLNLKFAKAGSRVDIIAPVLVHEGSHLAGAAARPDAVAEYRARRAELAACREIIRKDRWTRGCREAEELVGLGEVRALASLRAAGYG